MPLDKEGLMKSFLNTIGRSGGEKKRGKHNTRTKKEGEEVTFETKPFTVVQDAGQYKATLAVPKGQVFGQQEDQ